MFLNRIAPVSTATSVSLPGDIVMNPKSVITSLPSISDTIPLPSTSQHTKNLLFPIPSILITKNPPARTPPAVPTQPVTTSHFLFRISFAIEFSTS